MNKQYLQLALAGFTPDELKAHYQKKLEQAGFADQEINSWLRNQENILGICKVAREWLGQPGMPKKTEGAKEEALQNIWVTTQSASENTTVQKESQQIPLKSANGRHRVDFPVDFPVNLPLLSPSHHNNESVFLPHEFKNNALEINWSGYWDIAMSGFGESNSGLRMRIKNRDAFKKLLDARELADLSWDERLIYSLGAFAGDFQDMATGALAGAGVGLAGGPAAPATVPLFAMTGAFGYTLGVRQALMYELERGNIQGVDDALERLAGITLATVNGMAVGSITYAGGAVGGTVGRAMFGRMFAPASRFIGKDLASLGASAGGTAGAIVGETTGLVGGNAIVAQRMPQAQDWSDAAIFITALRFSNLFFGKRGIEPNALPSSTDVNTTHQLIVPKLRKLYVETGKTPLEIARAAQEDPTVMRDLMNKDKVIPDAFVEEARNRVLAGEKLPLEELKAYSDHPWARAELLERDGFWVDRGVFDAPIVLDGKQRYGVRFSTLEKEGTFGDRWTRIETKIGDWPEVTGTGNIVKGTARAWRDVGKQLYQRIIGGYRVSSTGESINVGRSSFQHLASQRQTAAAFKAIPYLPELIEKSFKVGEYNPKTSAGKTDHRLRSVYHSAAMMDGVLYDIQLVAKRNMFGEQELIFYDMRARNKQERFAGQQLLTRLEGQVSPPNTNLSHIKVSEFFKDVKEVIHDGPEPGLPANKKLGPTAGGGAKVRPQKDLADPPAGQPDGIALPETNQQSLSVINIIRKHLTVKEKGGGGDAVFKTTNHENGVTGLSKADRKIMVSSDWERAKSGEIQFAHRVVDKIWSPQKTVELKAKLDPGKEIVFLSVPSTTGRNTLPNALGERLARELGGEYVEVKKLYQVKAFEAMKDVLKIDRPFATRSYILKDAGALAELKGKQVVLTEDVITTGSSARQFALELRRQGVEVQTVAGLMGNARLDAPPQLVDKLHRTLRNAKMDIKGRDLANVLSTGEIKSIIDQINITGGAYERELLAKRIQGILHSRTAGTVD